MVSAPELVTPRLLLREVRSSDHQPAAVMWATPSVVRHVGGSPFSDSDTWRRLLQFAGLWSLLGYGYWTVEERSSGLFVGQAGLADFHRDIDASIAGVPEAGWAVSPRHEGKGYATEAVAALLYWADTHLPATQTCCLVEPGNRPSLRVADKLGFELSRETTLGDSITQIFFRARPH